MKNYGDNKYKKLHRCVIDIKDSDLQLLYGSTKTTEDMSIIGDWRTELSNFLSSGNKEIKRVWQTHASGLLVPRLSRNEMVDLTNELQRTKESDGLFGEIDAAYYNTHDYLKTEPDIWGVWQFNSKSFDRFFDKRIINRERNKISFEYPIMHGMEEDPTDLKNPLIAGCLQELSKDGFRYANGIAPKEHTVTSRAGISVDMDYRDTDFSFYEKLDKITIDTHNTEIKKQIKEHNFTVNKEFTEMVNEV
jgi:hypothetical protein